MMSRWSHPPRLSGGTVRRDKTGKLTRRNVPHLRTADQCPILQPRAADRGALLCATLSPRVGRLSGLPCKAADEEKSLEYQSAGMGTVRVQAYSTQYTL